MCGAGFTGLDFRVWGCLELRFGVYVLMFHGQSRSRSADYSLYVRQKDKSSY